MSIYKSGYVEPLREDAGLSPALRLKYAPKVASATAPALKLDKRTQLDQVRKTVVVRDYGHGVVEVGLSHAPLPGHGEVDYRPRTAQGHLIPASKVKKINLDRSIRRSRAMIRRKCMSGGLNYLLTLTTRENKTDLDASFKDLSRFIRKVKKTIPGWKYVAVVEFQKRGAIHFHVAVKGFQNVRVLRSSWLSIVGVGQGNVQVETPKNARYKSQKWHIAKLAGYLTKYITKDLCGVGSGRQRYRVAEGIEIPRQRTILSFPIGVDWLQEVFDSLGATLQFRYESKQGWAWACSW